MRKFLLLGGLAIFLVSIAQIASASVDSTFEVAIVTAVGDVKVDEKGDGRWADAIIGMRLKTGAAIKTGYASVVDIVYDAEGLNVVSIDENTQVTISRASLDMLKGSVLAKFDNLKRGSSFEVRTPTAACGIRGSGMGVDYIRNMTVVRAFEDRVYVRGRDRAGNLIGKEVMIPEGWKTQVEQEKVPEPPAELTENEKKVWDAWVEVLTGEVTEEEPVEEETLEVEEEVDTTDLSDLISGSS